MKRTVKWFKVSELSELEFAMVNGNNTNTFLKFIADKDSEVYCNINPLEIPEKPENVEISLEDKITSILNVCSNGDYEFNSEEEIPVHSFNKEIATQKLIELINSIKDN